jgi:hypothetical protein
VRSPRIEEETCNEIEARNEVLSYKFLFEKLYWWIKM